MTLFTNGAALLIAQGQCERKNGNLVLLSKTPNLLEVALAKLSEAVTSRVRVIRCRSKRARAGLQWLWQSSPDCSLWHSWPNGSKPGGAANQDLVANSGYPCTGNHRHPPAYAIIPRPKISIGIALETLGLMASLAFVVLLYRTLERMPSDALPAPSEWAPVPAKILEVGWHKPRRHSPFVLVRYAYDYSGARFEGEHRLYHSSSVDAEVLNRVVEAKSSEAPITVFVNPDEPQSSHFPVLAGATGPVSHRRDASALLLFGSLGTAIYLSYRLLKRRHPEGAE